VASTSLEYKYFKLSLGRDAIEYHYNTIETFSSAINDELSSPFHSAVRFMGCSSYELGRTAYQRALHMYGGQNTITIYTSRTDRYDCVCFILNPINTTNTLKDSTVTLKDIQQDFKLQFPEFFIFCPIPLVLFIDTRLLDSIRSLNNLNNVFNKHFELEISSLSSSYKIPKIEEKSVYQVLEGCRGAHVSDFDGSKLCAFSNVKGVGDNVVSAARNSLIVQSKLSLRELCDFSGLELLAYGSSSVKIPLSPSARGDCVTGLVAALLSFGVGYVSLAGQATTCNYYSSQGVQSGSLRGGDIYSSHGLDGRGVVVGGADTGIDTSSCFFSDEDGAAVQRSTVVNPLSDPSRRKVVQYVAHGDGSDSISGHGTHVFGTLAGSVDPTISSTYDSYNGVATGTKIAFFDVSRPNWNYLDVPALYSTVFPVASSANATLHSNSWVNNIYSYDSYCRDADKYQYENPLFLSFFAAGNNGPNARTVMAPAQSKNAISVGATGSGEGEGGNSLAYFSGRGPAYDGRLGVDVLAQGRSIKSAGSSASHSCGLVTKSGTSMATPAVAGAGALVSQYFTDPSFWQKNCDPEYRFCCCIDEGFKPSGSLVKTMLLHSGQDIGGGYGYPGYEQGFGRIDLSTVLLLEGVSDNFDLYVEDFLLCSGCNVTLVVNISSLRELGYLKATISWMDPPNIVAAGKQLLNDIDLTVRGMNASENMWFGNNGPESDDINNAEMIHISDPPCGTYNITLSAGLFVEHTHQMVSLVLTSTAGKVVGVYYESTDDLSNSDHMSSAGISVAHGISLVVTILSHLLAILILL